MTMTTENIVKKFLAGLKSGSLIMITDDNVYVGNNMTSDDVMTKIQSLSKLFTTRNNFDGIH